MTIEEMLREARSRIERVAPETVSHHIEEGAVVVDLRCPDERRRTGMIPGSIAMARSVIEWRADPASPWYDDRLDPERLTLLVCEDGYSSSLAADSLRRLGLSRVGDVRGGMAAWLELGFPLEETSDGS